MTEPHGPRNEPVDVDVAVVGGGAAGLTLALQLKRARPHTSIAVVEKAGRAPEAAHKVGESTVDIAAHYLRDILGLESHINAEQLEKFGLRFFFTRGDNSDMSHRIELGHAQRPRMGATYQLDRGRFENHLTDAVTDLGVHVWSNHRVDTIELSEGGQRHLIKATGPGSRLCTITASWVVDASGRASLLKRQLGLAKPNNHNVNAAWFRIDDPIDIQTWSDQPNWRQRITGGDRWLSTNHLMGEGYWVWLIPLASGSISVGIVADADIHPFSTINRFDRAVEWLRQHEPLCAAAVEGRRDKLMDFRVLRNYSYGCEQVYSRDGWCLTGESGIFLDPLYSPGFDVIALSNGLITDLISRSLDGEDISETAAIHNNVFFMMTKTWLTIYEGQYPIMGNARVMSAKILWDTGIYWAVPSLLFYNDMFPRLGDKPRVVAQMARTASLTDVVQKFFRQWYDVETAAPHDGLLTYYDFDFMTRFHLGMDRGEDEVCIDDQIAANLDSLELIAGELMWTVLTENETSNNDAGAAQARRWRADKAVMRLVEAYLASDRPEAWITGVSGHIGKGGGRGFSIRHHDAAGSEAPAEEAELTTSAALGERR